MPGKPDASEVAAELAGYLRVPVCEDCDVLRAANIAAIKFFGKKYALRFENNLSGMLTTHVDLGCQPCPVEKVLKLMRKDRLAAIAAMF